MEGKTEKNQDLIIEQGGVMSRFIKSDGWKILNDFINEEIANAKLILEINNELTERKLSEYQGKLKALRFIQSLPEDNFIEPIKQILIER